MPNQPNTYESTLKLDNVRSEHYGTTFKCVVNNSLGTDSHIVVLQEPGKPEEPTEVTLVETGADSVTISWVPGFDGGYNQTFVVTMFDQKTMRLLRTRDLGPSERNQTTVEGLSQHTSYLIRLQGKNKVGMSKSGGEVFFKTRGSKYMCIGVVNSPKGSGLLTYDFSQPWRTRARRRRSCPE